jgi:hypothetical protein
MKKTVILALLANSIFGSQECTVPYSIMFAISENEHHPKRKIGYPYLISFNNKSDVAHYREVFPDYFIKEKKESSYRTIDCRSQEECVQILETILASGTTNVDLGGFQLNYKWHKIPLADYFSLKRSYTKACDYVMHLSGKYGWSWETVGRYHSLTEKLYLAYASKAQKNYLRRVK